MRTLLKITMDVEAASKALKSGELPKIISELSEKIKPEASYFTSYHGKRTAFIVFDMTDTSNMPYYFEPIFDKLKADIELMPVMILEDLEKGFKKLM